MAFTIGTARFTNGNPIATSVSYSQGGSAYIASGTSLIVGANPVTAQVSASGVTSNTITMHNDWDYPTGTYTFVATYTTESLRDAVSAAKGFSEQLEITKNDFNNTIDGLGTAAGKDAVTNNADSTVGGLTSVGWGGIGGDRIAKQVYGNDLLNIAADSNYNGWVMEVSVDTDNRPSIAPVNLAGHVVRMQSTLLMIASYPVADEGSVYVGYWDGLSISWSKQYSSKDVNFNEFGLSSAPDDVIAIGFARSSNIADFYLPINYISAPSSISLIGTLKILDAGGSEVGSSSSSYLLNSASSDKVAKISRGSGLSGLSAGQPLFLVKSDSTSKLNVNP